MNWKRRCMMPLATYDSAFMDNRGEAARYRPCLAFLDDDPKSRNNSDIFVFSSRVVTR